jgi:hypothetical protein
MACSFCWSISSLWRLRLRVDHAAKVGLAPDEDDFRFLEPSPPSFASPEVSSTSTSSSSCDRCCWSSLVSDDSERESEPEPFDDPVVGTDDEREDVSRPLELLLLIGLEMPFPVFLNCIRWWLPPAVPFSPDLPCLSSSPPSLPLLASTLPLSTLPLLQPPLKDDSPFRGELPDEPLASSG